MKKEVTPTKNLREPPDRWKTISSNQMIEGGGNIFLTRQLYEQKFSTTSKICRPTQQLKRSIVTVPLNLCANIQCGWWRYYRAQPCGTLVHNFFGLLFRQKTPLDHQRPLIKWSKVRVTFFSSSYETWADNHNLTLEGEGDTFRFHLTCETVQANCTNAI
jgi:hypothetical protein